MRIGAILASGGCRALRWTAMSGVALALGAGQAAAQTFTVDESFGDNGVTIVAAATEDLHRPRPAGHLPRLRSAIANACQ